MAGAADGSLRMWARDKRECLWVLQRAQGLGPEKLFSLSPFPADKEQEDDMLVSGDKAGGLTWWAYEGSGVCGGSGFFTRHHEQTRHGAIFSMCLTPDALFCGTGDGAILVRQSRASATPPPEPEINKLLLPSTAQVGRMFQFSFQ